MEYRARKIWQLSVWSQRQLKISSLENWTLNSFPSHCLGHCSFYMVFNVLLLWQNLFVSCMCSSTFLRHQPSPSLLPQDDSSWLGILLFYRNVLKTFMLFFFFFLLNLVILLPQFLLPYSTWQYLSPCNILDIYFLLLPIFLTKMSLTLFHSSTQFFHPTRLSQKSGNYFHFSKVPKLK